MSIFKLPDLGEGLTEAELNQWYVAVGDDIEIDQPLCAVETAKALVDIPSPFTGKVTELCFQAGDVMPTGADLVKYEDAKATASSSDNATVVGELQQSEHIWQTAIPARQSSTTASIKATPAIRALATKLNVNLTEVTASGANGNITAQDVEAAAHDPQYEPLHSTRRTMAQTMAAAHKEVVAVTLVEDAVLPNYSASYDTSINLIQGICLAIAKEPALNCWFKGQTLSRYISTEVNMGIACDTKDGLFVPVIRNAQTKNAADLRTELNNIKDKIETRSIKPEDLTGATITLSNFGKFCGRYATPIVVPPQVAILAAGKLRPGLHNENGDTCHILPLSLTFDHRAVTGGEAARFLAVIVEHLGLCTK